MKYISGQVLVSIQWYFPKKILICCIFANNNQGKNDWNMGGCYFTLLTSLVVTFLGLSSHVPSSWRKECVKTWMGGRGKIHTYIHTYIFINPRSHVTIQALYTKWHCIQRMSFTRLLLSNIFLFQHINLIWEQESLHVKWTPLIALLNESCIIWKMHNPWVVATTTSIEFKSALLHV